MGHRSKTIRSATRSLHRAATPVSQKKAPVLCRKKKSFRRTEPNRLSPSCPPNLHLPPRRRPPPPGLRLQGHPPPHHIPLRHPLCGGRRLRNPNVLRVSIADEISVA